MGNSTCKKSIIYPCGNGQTYCEFRKKAPRQWISPVAYRTTKSHGFSGWWIPSQDPDWPGSKIFLLSPAKSFHSFEVQEELYETCTLLGSGDVEYAYCGPSCAAGKSRFCNHILALMMKVCKYSLYDRCSGPEGWGRWEPNYSMHFCFGNLAQIATSWNPFPTCHGSGHFQSWK